MSHIVTTQLEEVLTTQYMNLYDHLKTFIKLELENRTKVELNILKWKIRKMLTRLIQLRNRKCH